MLIEETEEPRLLVWLSHLQALDNPLVLPPGSSVVSKASGLDSIQCLSSEFLRQPWGSAAQMGFFHHKPLASVINPIWAQESGLLKA